MRKKSLAIYGKGGIGKSSTASNVAAAMGERGIRVMLVGCDPKSDSSITLLNGRRIPTIMDLLRRNGRIEREEQVVYEGFNGVRCAEVGGPEPGIGCAGRGIIVAVQELQKVSDALRTSDVVMFDVPGDIVCGGFAVPITKGMVREAYIITSGEYMPVYAANNICRGLKTLKTPLSGVIGNAREASGEREIVEAFAARMGVPMLAFVPRDRVVQDCERAGKSVIEGSPGAPVAGVYREIAERIIDGPEGRVPEPLDDDTLRQLTLA